MDSFHHKEKLKRINLTKQLLDKGFSIRKLADYFGVGESTVREYIRQIKEFNTSAESNVVLKQPETEKFENTLSRFTEKSISTSDFFKDKTLKTDRVRCPLCNLLINPDNVTTINNKKICKNCFKTLDAKTLNNL
ncbi:MAG: hypothetical protein U9R08_06750 [Nanoarchaeota archaeon]|nr:hypothetical protein [Nanoarchaeota archaeon]